MSMLRDDEIRRAVLSAPAMWACCTGGAEQKDTSPGRTRDAGLSRVEVVGKPAYRKSTGPDEKWKRDLLSIGARGTGPVPCC